ncbi:MAG: hypothetical protein LBT27_03180, partial [Prevotellaceae bacterium]|nr:hypothetical protein [Prevotellaceae bacterium]
MKKLLLTLTIVFAANSMFAKQEEYKREVNKEFTVSANAYLSIINKYGDVNIVEGNEGKITFKIEITGKGKIDVARDYAEGVDIDFTSSSNHISAKTTIPNMNCSNCGITINYVVVVPRSTTMDFDVKYGNIILNDTPKPLNVIIKYGNINANTISDAKIDIGYGKVNIDKCKDLNLIIKYSNLKINKVDNLKLESKYSKFTIDEINSIKSDSKYDDFRIGTITDFNIATGYADVIIDKLNNSFVANEFRYCKLRIDNIADNFSKIIIDAAYTNVKLGLNQNHSFKATLDAEYGEIKSGKIMFNNVLLSKKNTIVGNAGKSSNPTA